MEPTATQNTTQNQMGEEADSTEFETWFAGRKAPAPTGRVLLSLFAAFVGMFIGLLPELLYAVTIHGSYPLMFLFIPLGCYLGISVLKCRNVRQSFIWVVVFAVIGWYVAEVIAGASNNISENALPAGQIFSLIGTQFFGSWTNGAIRLEPFYSYIFLAFGCWVAYEYIVGGHAFGTAKIDRNAPDEAEEEEEPEPEKLTEEKSRENGADENEEFETYEDFMKEQEKPKK